MVWLTVPPNAGGSARALEQRQQGQRSRPPAVSMPQSAIAKTSSTSITTSSSIKATKTSGNYKKVKSKNRDQDSFNLEDNDNWPQVDVGNLIIDLDADIDKAMSSAATSDGQQQASAPVAGPAQAPGLNPSNPAAASQQGKPQQPSMPPGSTMKTLVTSKG